MNRRLEFAAFLLGLAACSTSTPPLRESGATAENPAAGKESAEDPGEVVVAEIPEVPKVTDIPVRDEVICRMEKRTGTNRAVRICRSRSQNARTAREGKEAFEILRRSQTEY